MIAIGPVPIYTDSKNCIDSLMGEYPSAKAKHFCMLWYEVKEYLIGNLIELRFVDGVDNTADVLTKPLVKVVHEKHVANLLMDRDGAE